LKNYSAFFIRIEIIHGLLCSLKLNFCYSPQLSNGSLFQSPQLSNGFDCGFQVTATVRAIVQSDSVNFGDINFKALYNSREIEKNLRQELRKMIQKKIDWKQFAVNDIPRIWTKPSTKNIEIFFM
jgi:hypothetical protein